MCTYTNQRTLKICKINRKKNRVFYTGGILVNLYRKYQLHAVFFFKLRAVSHTQQGRQRDSSVKTHRSPLSAEFWRHCVLSGGTQRQKISNIIKISFLKYKQVKTI